MPKDKSYRTILKYILSASIIAGLLGATLFAQAPNSKATAKLATLSKDFSAADIEEIRSLIDSGADVNVRNELDVTALHMASQDGYTDTDSLPAAAEQGDIGLRYVTQRLEGQWILDVDYVREYLKKGSELQELWCGAGWPESDIVKREQFIKADAAKNGPIVKYDIHAIAGDSLELLQVNNQGKESRKLLFNFTSLDSGMISCSQLPASDRPFVFRIENGFVYIMLKMTPDMMKCQLVSNTPSEMWIAVMRLKNPKEH